MKYLHLVWRNLLRRKVRTLFTFLSIMVAFLLYGFLAAISAGFSMGVQLAGNDRLMMLHKVSIIQPLPESYGPRIRSVAGVRDVTHATWFGGIYQNPRNFFAQMPVNPEEWMRMYPEFLIPEDQKKAWLADRTGAVAGRAIVERFGWKIGDRIPLQATIWRPKTGNTWEFTLSGIYDGARKGTDTTQFFFRHDYFDENRVLGKGLVGWYVIRIDKPNDAPAVAERIDSVFANSAYETKTATEKAFVQGFAKQIGDIGAIMTAIVSAVFFTILLVAGNTMAQSVRERTNELAILKTLGYSNPLILTLVMTESCVVAVAAGAVGLAIAWILILQGDPTGGFLPAYYFPPQQLATGIALVIALGLLSGILPGLSATRLRIVDALRRA